MSALSNYRADLARFRSESLETLDTIGYQLRRETEWIRGVVHQRQDALRQARASLDQAQRALQECIAAQTDDGGPDCSACAAAVTVGREEVERADHELHVVEQSSRELDAARGSYERIAQQFRGVVTTNVPQAMAVLDHFGRALEGYRVVAIPSGSGATAGAIASAPSPAVRPSSAPTSALLVFPAVGATDLVEVPVALIDFRDSTVSGPESYRKISYAEMRRGIFALEEVVLPAVRRGASGDHFSAMDDERGLAYHDGFRRVFDSFFGDESIRVDRSGERLSVTNGYHRLHIARELGLRTVPARVSGQRGDDGAMR